MISQVALNDTLPNPFSLYSFTEISSKDSKSCTRDFEDGKILVIEGLEPEGIDFFLDLPVASFDDWIPPIFSGRITGTDSANNPLIKYYDEKTIISFQEMLPKFQQSWINIQEQIFRDYDFKTHMISWRMNKMDLGYLHFDIPENNFPEHQLRTFINLSHRPRVLEIGPTLEQIVNKFYHSLKLEKYFSLPNDKFIEAIKMEVLKKQNFEDFYLPRHYLSLAPKAIWICNAFLISHGLVFGEKTVCMESRIKAESMNRPSRHFVERLEKIRSNPTNSDIPSFQLFL